MKIQIHALKRHQSNTYLQVRQLKRVFVTHKIQVKGEVSIETIIFSNLLEFLENILMIYIISKCRRMC